MRVLDALSRIHVDDERVAVCGDWHGNANWVRTILAAISGLAPDVSTILQLGDWWLDAERLDGHFQRAGIERVLVTSGNHEPWGSLTPLMDAYPGQAVRVSEVTWILPRPARLSIGGREVVSLGGAASVDRAWRRPGRDWWPDEVITDEQVEKAISGGRADVMLSHESPEGTPVRAVNRILQGNPMSWPADALKESAASRRQVTRVWEATFPELLLHGHLHAAGGGRTADGRRVASMGCDGQEGALGFLDMRTLEMTTPSLREVHAVAWTR